MKKFLMSAVCSCGVLLAAGAAIADVPVFYTEGDRPIFRIDVPDHWYMRSGGDRDVTAPGTDDSRLVSRVLGLEPVNSDDAWLGFVVPDRVTTLAQAEAYLQEVGPSLVRDATPVTRKDGRIGGYKAVIYTGTGRSGSTPVRYTAALIDLPGKRIAIGVAVLRQGASQGYIDQINGVFDSFRVAR